MNQGTESQQRAEVVVYTGDWISGPAPEIPRAACGRCEDWTTVVVDGVIRPCPECRPEQYAAWLANSARARSAATVRTNHVGAVTVHAGSLDELAAVADEYADGRRPMPRGLTAGHLKRAAERLRAGDRVHDLGPIRFYADAADGTPFRAPYAPPAEA